MKFETPQGTKPAGNFKKGAIYESTRDTVTGETGPSYAEHWLSRGISFTEGDPFPTDYHTSAQLRAMDMVGVTLWHPKPEQTPPQDQ